MKELLADVMTAAEDDVDSAVHMLVDQLGYSKEKALNTIDYWKEKWQK